MVHVLELLVLVVVVLLQSYSGAASQTRAEDSEHWQILRASVRVDALRLACGSARLGVGMTATHSASHLKREAPQLSMSL